MTYAPYRDRFTVTRDELRAAGEAVVVTLDVTAMDRLAPGEACRMCAVPAVLSIELSQTCHGVHSSRDLEYACDNFCARCVEQHAPGLLAAARRWERVRDTYRAAFRAGRGAPVVAFVTGASGVLADLRAAAPEVLQFLGYDPETCAEAVQGLVTAVIVSPDVAELCIAGPDVPGGELHFSPDGAAPDGPLGDVAVHWNQKESKP